MGFYTVMIKNILKNILSKVTLLSLGIALNVNSTQAMEKEERDERDERALSSVLLSQKKNVEFINLPFEDQMFILERLSVQDLGRCAQVCRDWKIISSHEYLWGKIAKEHTSSDGCLWVKNMGEDWKKTMEISFPKDKKLKKSKKEWLSDPWKCDKPYPSLQVLLISQEYPSAFQTSFEKIQEFKADIKEKIRDLTREG